MTRVVCVGLATLDVVQRVTVPPVWGAKSVSDRVELVAGGPTTNAAVTAAAMLRGAGEVVLVTAVGRGPAADVVRSDLTAHGVELVDLAPEGDELPVATCVVHPDGERTVVSPGAAASRWALVDHARAALAGATAVLVDGHHPVAAHEALASSREAVTVLDAGSVKAHVEGWLPLVDVAAASSAYARGLALTHDETLAHLLARGAGAALVTAGPEPVLWRTGDDRGAVAPPGIRAVDSLGAGDAFHGALTAALAVGDELPAAIRHACDVAALRVQHADSRAWLADL